MIGTCTWTILSGFVSLVVAIWIWFQISNRNVLRLCRAIPRAQPCLPLLGNILEFISVSDIITEYLLVKVEEAVHKGHKAVCFWLGCCPLVVLTNPDDIKKVLNNSLSRGKVFEKSCMELGKYGLVLSPVDHWKVTRRHLNLSFHSRNLEHMIPTFNSVSRRLVDDLSEHVDSGFPLNLQPHVMSAAVRSISTFIFGSKTMEFVSEEQLQKMIHTVQLASELMAVQVTRPWLGNGIIFKFFYQKKINFIKETCKDLSQIANSVLETCKDKERLESNIEHEKCEGHFQNILSAMRELQEKSFSVTDEYVMDEIVSFLATGTDTIGVTVSSCLLALAKFPQIQHKVYEEGCSVLSAENDISFADLNRLSYLDQVIKEALRFFPVVPFVSRVLTRDVRSDKYTVPANCELQLCLSAVFSDPKHFPDPHKFDPDRFSTSSSSESVFMPFGLGPRNCIGKLYAMMLMKVMIAHVVQKYRLSTNMDVQNLKKSFSITLSLCGGYNVLLSTRNKQDL